MSTKYLGDAIEVEDYLLTLLLISKMALEVYFMRLTAIQPTLRWSWEIHAKRNVNY